MKRILKIGVVYVPGVDQWRKSMYTFTLWFEASPAMLYSAHVFTVASHLSDSAVSGEEEGGGIPEKTNVSKHTHPHWSVASTVTPLRTRAETIRRIAQSLTHSSSPVPRICKCPSRRNHAHLGLRGFRQP